MSFKSQNVGYTGNIICKGNGLKVYFEIKAKRYNGEKVEEKIFRYNVGNIDSIMEQTDRRAGQIFVAGEKTAVGIAKGIRSSFGNVTFSQIDRGMIKYLIEDIYKWQNQELVPAGDIFGDFSVTGNTLFDPGSQLLSLGDTSLKIKIRPEKVKRLEDLPPLNIVVVARADQTDIRTGDIVDFNQTYVKRIKGVSFMSSNFGISAGGPLHNVNANMLVLQGVEDWRLAKEDEI